MRREWSECEEKAEDPVLYYISSEDHEAAKRYLQGGSAWQVPSPLNSKGLPSSRLDWMPTLPVVYVKAGRERNV